MEILHFFIDFILHIDVYLEDFVRAYGVWVYVLLFVILFIETGLVIMPFLPGDSLLFVVGALCGLGLMDYTLTVLLLPLAPILGDQTNYSVGRYIGPRAFQWENSRFFNKQALSNAHNFYEKHGSVTIILARFFPFLRTFIPFIAGVAQMTRWRYTLFGAVGSVIWVCSLVTLGYYLGNLPWVRMHLDKIIWALILIPGVIFIVSAWRKRYS